MNMIVKDLENVIQDSQLIELKVIEREYTKQYESKTTTEYKIYFERVIELYGLYDVDKITVSFEGDLYLIISN